MRKSTGIDARIASEVGPTTLSRGPVVRTLIAATYIVVVGALFLQREFRSNDTPAGMFNDAGTAPTVGLLDEQAVGIGSPVPDFVLQAHSGGVLRLSDYRGKSVVLNFWASWCEPCKREFPELNGLSEARRDADDLVVIAVNEDRSDLFSGFLGVGSRSAADRFITDFQPAFPIAFDTDSSDVAKRFGVQRLLPTTFFIDGSGVLRAQTYGELSGALLARGVEAADTSTTVAPQ